MYRVLILVTVLVVATWAELDEADLKKCMRLLHPHSRHCCKGALPLKISPLAESAMKECMPLQRQAPSCDREICMASKLGFASSDGEIDKTALQELVEKELEDNPELSKLIIDKCVNGDISKYGPADLCDLMKLRICKDTQFAKSCQEWDNNGPCAGIKDLAEECAEKLE